ncbi:unnamed protein product [Dibothriocephalus latus]|uniref:Uncharacterized protein n=1 Tax=Dibothriocephalus latus TaxID=60516 RepID=A0A3P7M6N7_DIBLA|nr:unnamed protein product [Dibothriocephalus latus]
METNVTLTSSQSAPCLAWDFSTRFLMEDVIKRKTKNTSRPLSPKHEVNSRFPGADLACKGNLLRSPSQCNTLAFLTDDPGGKVHSRTVSASMHASCQFSAESEQLEKEIINLTHHRGDIPSPLSDCLSFSLPPKARSLQVCSGQERVTAALFDPKEPENSPPSDSPSECVSYPTCECTDSSSETTLLPSSDDCSLATFIQPETSPSSLSLSSSETPSSISPTSDLSLFSLSLHVCSTKDAVTQCGGDTETALLPNGLTEPRPRAVSVDPIRTKAPIDVEEPKSKESIKQKADEVQKIERKVKGKNPWAGHQSGFSCDRARSLKTQTAGRTELRCVHRLTPRPLPGFLQNNRSQKKEFSSVSRPKMRAAQFRQLLLFRSNPNVTRRFIIRDNQCLQLLEGLARDGYCKDRRLFCTLNNYAGARAELVAAKPAYSYGRLTYFLYLHARTWDQMRWIVRDIDRYYPQWCLPAQLTQ